MWVIQTAFLGDCVLSLPFIVRALEHFPEAKLKIISGPAGEALFRLACERGLKPEAHRIEIHRFNKREDDAGFAGLYRFVRRLSKDDKPERVFCLQRSFRSGLMALLSGAPERVGFSSGAASFFYSQAVRREWDSGKSEVEKNLDLLRAIRPEVERWRSKTAPSLLESPAIKAKLGPLEDRPVLLSLGSPWPTKRWPVENAVPFAKAVVAEGIELRLIGDASAKPLAEALKKEVPSLLVKDLCGKTSIPEWVDEIAAARVVVSGDSAAVHVASDLNIPVVALFGPTLPEFGFAPWRSASVALGISNLYCRPCDIHGPKCCPEGHHRCLRDLSGETVFKQLDKMLRSSSTI